jgi:hypothetical protein
MQDIKLTIPTGLTAAQVKSMALISEQAAYEIAVELHSVVADYRALFALRPRCGVYGEFEETDVVATILRTAVNVWPLDADVCGKESVWLFERFSAVDGDELYERYLRLFDRINGTDFADLAGC